MDNTKQRKTIKYYREVLKNTNNVTECVNALRDVVKRYGEDNRIRLDRPESHWDGYFTYVCTNRKGEVFVNRYWQGGDTDGDELVKFADIFNKSYTIPQSSYYDGYRTRINHHDIRIDKDEWKVVVNGVLKKLEPKSRKVVKK